ncbi:MAG TPA: hypothetical protein VLM85_31020, partial [Polyangiaceae bacterium]|nr:hypothetical protein [Polyangiaceae bacterium]
IYAATGAKDTAGNSLVNHGMVGNAFGILAGVVIAGILTRDLKDSTEPEPEAAPTPTSPNAPPGTPSPSGPTARRRSAPSWRPPFTVSVAPLPGGATLGVFGEW